MRFAKILAAVSLVVSATSAQTLYLAGDSTMANDGGEVYKGWGTQISKYVGLTVVNDATAGRSARSYTDEGRFASIAAVIKSGDFVVIEFGHNDGGDPTTSSLSPCFGPGTTVTCTGAAGQTVFTWEKYIENAVNTFKALGAHVIVSSQTPDNPYSVGFGAPRFVGYAQIAASDTAVTYVDHFDYVIAEYTKLGNATVTALYPVDHTHTSVQGADIVAQTFVRAVLCNTANPLRSHITNSTVVPTSCL